MARTARAGLAACCDIFADTARDRRSCERRMPTSRANVWRAAAVRAL